MSKVKKSLAIVIGLVMVFTMVVPALAASTMNTVSGQNPVFLGTELPPFVVFSDGQIGPGGAGQDVVVWTPDGTGDWATIKDEIINTGGAPGWMVQGNYVFHGFFYGIGFENRFWGGQNHYFTVEEKDGRWYAVKRDLNGNISGTISNTIFYGDVGVTPRLYGALEVDVEAEQTTITTTRTEVWQQTLTPTQTLTKYVSQNFSSVTATTPEQWALRTCPTVINTRNGNPIHPNNRNANWYNPLVVFNANHFVYASLCYPTLAAGGTIPLVLVVGNNFNQVGAGVVTYANGELTITFQYGLFSGSWGAVSFNNMLGVPNNGNIHSIGGGNGARQMAEIGASGNGFSHNIGTYSVTIPAATPNSAGNVYLYIHGSFSFLRGYHLSDPVYVVTAETLVDYFYEDEFYTELVDVSDAVIRVYNAAGDLVVEGTGSSLTVANLLPGYYRVTVTFAGKTLYQERYVAAGGTTEFDFEFVLENIYLTDPTVITWLEPIILPPVINTVIVRR